MATLIEDLNRIEGELNDLVANGEEESIQASLQRVEDAATDAHKAFSGSWIGYHARVYYKNLSPPPAGAHFNSIWGLSDRYLSDTVGEWCVADQHKLFEALKAQAGRPSLETVGKKAVEVGKSASEHQQELLSVIEACLGRTEDAYITKMKAETEGARIISADDWIEHYRPTGSFPCSDMQAIGEGVQIPPHVRVQAIVDHIRSCFSFPNKLARIAKQTASHLGKREKAKGIASKQGNKVFLGHGGSEAWRQLKDFIEETLGLEVDEFNQKPIAGMTNITRLLEMLDDAAIAFLVMTAEDEQKDGTKHARMNVIHEAGLFQGRLGFTRAIVVLEEGCEEFSNIQGLGQIRFPPKKIKSAFQEVREVLERENLV